MNKKLITASLLSATLLGACKEKAPQLGVASVDEVIAAMTLEEKVNLLVGEGMEGISDNAPVVGESFTVIPGAAGTTFGIPRLGIPTIVLADGPAGVRIQPIRENDDNTYYCTAFPIATLLASTWNTELAQQVGEAMGNEALEYGADVLLAPAMNIHRNPLCGRSFEYYSEDPIVSGKLGAAITKGVQSNGIAVSLKHFAGNNQETNRLGSDTRVSVRAMREIYLKGFEIAVKEANPWTVMSSYNYINGVYASESRELLTTILRDEWGFNGTVMTDWFGGIDAPGQLYAGNDLLMPGSNKQKKAIIDAVESGRLSESDVDVNVKRILELILNTPTFKKYNYSSKPDLKAHASITRQSAAEGMVLLKNEGNTLPLASSVKKVAAYGITSYDFISGGTGSGDVNEAYTVSLSEGLANAGYTLDAELSAQYEEYLKEEYAKIIPDTVNVLAQFMPKIRPLEFLPSIEDIKEQVKRSDVALITIGRTSGEFVDRKLEADYELTEVEKKLIATVTQVYQAAGKKAIVILNIGGVIETSSWKSAPNAILLAWQAGQEGGNSVADALCGRVNPSGKLTMTFPVNYTDVPSSKNFPGQPYDSDGGLARMMGGEVEDKKELVRDIDYTIYEEDIYVGYRYFDTFKKDVSFAFGHGLSYTTFAYNNPKIELDKSTNTFVISVEIKNTGKVAGKEIVQLYTTAPTNAQGKPLQELKAFAKTKELKAGESQLVTLNVAVADLASYDESISSWVTEKGNYLFHLSASSRDVRTTVAAEVAESILVKTNDVLKTQERINLLKP